MIAGSFGAGQNTHQAGAVFLFNQSSEVLAATSHLPHLLAYSLVDTLANTHENKEIFNYAAGGFRDFARIAASSPVMWRDIFSANKDELLKTLDLFSEDLTKLRTLIEQEDSTGLMGVLTRAKAARDHFSNILARRAYMEPGEKRIYHPARGTDLSEAVRRWRCK